MQPIAYQTKPAAQQTFAQRIAVLTQRYERRDREYRDARKRKNIRKIAKQMRTNNRKG